MLYRRAGYVIHTLRKAYGWTDEYFFDKVEELGLDWIVEQFRWVKEDDSLKWNMLLNIIPVARTPLSKEVGSAMNKSEKSIRKHILEAFTPWKSAHEERRKMFESKYGIKSGEMAIVYGAGEAGLAKDLAKDSGVRIVKGK